jgi:nucleoside-triphosphatase
LQLINIKIGITGLPGAGKTQALKKVIEMLEQEGVKIGGMITEPIVEDKHRKGFQIVDWMTKQKRVFAHLSQIQSKVTIGRYKVDLTALDEVGVPALRGAIDQADLIVIDEVGKMELESESFVKTVKDALDAEKPLILTLFKKSRNPLLQDIRRRDDIRILEVTTVNKNLLPFKIHKLLLGEML